MKRLDTPYNGKCYKFAFKHIETGEWFLANKKPKDIVIKEGYFGSFFATHYKYKVSTLLYNVNIKPKIITKNYEKLYNEHQFVCGMIKALGSDLYTENKRRIANPGVLHIVDKCSHIRKQIKYFKQCKHNIETSKEYLWETLKA